MKKYDAIIWDWNGTLLDDLVLALAVVNELLTEYGVPALTPARYKEIFDFPVRSYYERAGLDLERHDFHQISEKFCARFEDRLHLARLFPAARAILEAAHGAGTRQFILSGTEQDSLDRMMKRFGLTSIIESAQGLPDKLAGGKFVAGRQLIERCQIESGRSVLIGDTSHDADVARELGMECFLVESGHHSRERLSRLGLPIFPSLDALSVNLLQCCIITPQ
jgi:phosphoglycolate phosphatase